jgi:DNA polymerase-3 subunit delta
LQAMQRGSNIGAAMREARIWGSNLSQIENAVRRIKFAHIERAMQQAARLDKTIKGLRRGDVWDELLQLGLRFAKA